MPAIVVIFASPHHDADTALIALRSVVLNSGGSGEARLARVVLMDASGTVEGGAHTPRVAQVREALASFGVALTVYGAGVDAEVRNDETAFRADAEAMLR